MILYKMGEKENARKYLELALNGKESFAGREEAEQIALQLQ
jgi:hypothetical protein